MRFGLSTALVILPFHPQYHFHISEHNKLVSISNTGNAVLSITLHAACHEHKTCRLAARVYPGRVVQLNTSTFEKPMELYLVGYQFAQHRTI